jgi:hypothetical protein
MAEIEAALQLEVDFKAPEKELSEGTLASGDLEAALAAQLNG